MPHAATASSVSRTAVGVGGCSPKASDSCCPVLRLTSRGPMAGEGAVDGASDVNTDRASAERESNTLAVGSPGLPFHVAVGRGTARRTELRPPSSAAKSGTSHGTMDVVANGSLSDDIPRGDLKMRKVCVTMRCGRLKKCVS